MTDPTKPTVLISEDGSEYYDVLSRFIPDFQFIGARDGYETIDRCRQNPVSLVFLDMDFSRTPRHRLMGDHTFATRLCNGMPDRGWRYLAENQGLYILHALAENGLSHIPVLLSRDFSGEQRRFEKLQATYPRCDFLPGPLDPKRFIALVNAMIK